MIEKELKKILNSAVEYSEIENTILKHLKFKDNKRETVVAYNMGDYDFLYFNKSFLKEMEKRGFTNVFDSRIKPSTKTYCQYMIYDFTTFKVILTDVDKETWNKNKPEDV